MPSSSVVTVALSASSRPLSATLRTSGCLGLRHYQHASSITPTPAPAPAPAHANRHTILHPPLQRGFHRSVPWGNASLQGPADGTPLSLAQLQYLRRRNLSLALLGIAGTVLGLSLYGSNVVPVLHNDAPAAASDAVRGEGTAAARPTVAELVRAYIVYSLCSSATLVDHSPVILKTLMGVPGLGAVVEVFVRRTFFDQFVGGDTAADCVPLLQALRHQNKGALFAYSVEVDEYGATSANSDANGKAKSGEGAATLPENAKLPAHKRIVEEMLRCIDVAAEFEDETGKTNESMGRKTWVAIKVTALLPDAKSLINLSKHIILTRSHRAYAHGVPFPGCPESYDLDVLSSSSPGATSALEARDIRALTELKDDLRRICVRAKEKGVKVIIDAEYSWYQPAIDAYTLMLTQEFNRLDGLRDRKHSVRPLVYGTYQAYLRRTPKHLEAAFQHAKANGYALGVKLVRGAYHPHEIAAHRPPLPPISISDSAYTSTATTTTTTTTTDITTTTTATAHNSLERAGKKSLSISPDPEPPVWLTKDDTDRCYNACVKMLFDQIEEDLRPGTLARARGGVPVVLNSTTTSHRDSEMTTTWWSPVRLLNAASAWLPVLSAESPPHTNTNTKTNDNDNTALVKMPSGSSDREGACRCPRVGVLFGTHNWTSSALILDEIVKRQLGNVITNAGAGAAEEEERVVNIPDAVAERVAVGQLYGMSDELTDWLVNRTKSSNPVIIKYVPYGALSEVMPYLGRRAIENKSVLGDGGATRERKRAGREIMGRVREMVRL